MRLVYGSENATLAARELGVTRHRPSATPRWAAGWEVAGLARVRRVARSRHWSWRVLRLHATLIVLVASFVILANWQWRRALSGHELSWAYAFEWPLFIIYAFVLWHRLVLDEVRGTERSKRRRFSTSFLDERRRRRAIDLERRGREEDAARARYNEYLESIASANAPSTSRDSPEAALSGEALEKPPGLLKAHPEV